MDAPRPFDLLDPLPRGRLAIEASAGTGKTHTLSTLAARYVAEDGVAIGDLLIVTFTRAAAAELKDRVRGGLVELAEVLARDDRPNDPALALVWGADRELRLGRVRAALTDFDAATITTIHGFAQQVIGTLGAAARTDPSAVLIDDADALSVQVATDRLVAHALDDSPTVALPTLRELRSALNPVLGNPDALLVPDTSLLAGREEADDADRTTDDEEEELDEEAQQLAADRVAVRRRTFIDEVLEEVDARRRTAGTLSFDDLLVRLRDALSGTGDADAARAALRERYRVVLIDEFQDTDPVQWSIFDTVFGTERDHGAALVLVGDPKQAIYAFRGANVHTYLQAARSPGTERRGLDRNWRSDPAVLRATDALLQGVTFGADEIRFQPVHEPDHHADRRFEDASGDELPALSIRLASGAGLRRSKDGSISAGVGEPAVFRELAAYVRDLLETAVIPDEAHADGRTRPLRPEDVCVLIAANRMGPVVRDALRNLRIPAVIARGDDVLTSEAATHWHRLLHALARPADGRRVRGAALTWFFGWDGRRAATASERDLGELQELLHDWGEHLSRRGVAAFVGRVLAQTGVTERVLALADGDRAMTDLHHVAELLTLACARNPSPTTALTTFEQLSGGSDDGDPEADLAARRVESESSAVQIMTTYVAKGLEFPVVCCPTLWNPMATNIKNHVWWDDEATARTVDVATSIAWGSPEQLAERRRRTLIENVGSDLRVLYVALTRAEHHTAVWWLPTSKVWGGALARVLFARDAGGAIDPDAFVADELDRIDEAAALAVLQPVAEHADGALEVRSVDDPGPGDRPWLGAGHEAAPTLSVATLDRALDRAPTRWSFSALAARAKVDHAGFDPFDDALGDAGATDEGPDPRAALDADADADVDADGLIDDRATPPVALPLGDIAGGAGFGTLVHEVLERIDFTADDLTSEIGAAVDDRLAWNPWPVDRDQLVRGLVAIARTPLGPLFAGRPLCDLAPADRLDEMVFDLRLGDGGRRASDAAVGALLVDHLPASDPLRPWAESIAAGPFHAELAGHLTGSIDLVARVRHDDGIDRFVVCDYKTNRLAARGTTATAAHFAPDQLPAAMAAHHYPLQALLYSVALHRYLRWRVAGYDPTVHLGGVGYLFVRGMIGPDTPTVDDVPHGLFDWRPPAPLVTDLSDLLHGAVR